MQIDAAELDRWLARFAPDAEIVLGRDGVRPPSTGTFDLSTAGFGPGTDDERAVRSTLASRYDRRGEEVLLTTGSREATLLSLLSLLDADQHAVVLTPTTHPVEALSGMLGDVTTVAASPPDWGVDLDAVAEATRPETGLILAANPVDPTGRRLGGATVEALYELAADADAYLCCDERGRGLLSDPPPSAAALGPRGLATGDLSVAFGLDNLGWIAGPPAVVSAARHWRDYTTGGPSALDTHVARQALDREDELLDDNRALVEENRATVAATLDAAGLDWHDPAGAVGFPAVPEGFASGGAFCRQLLRETSVLFAPGDAVGVRDHFRIGFGVDPETLATGLDRLGEFLDRHA